MPVNAVRSALERLGTQYRAVRSVEVHHDDGTVKIRGTVPTYHIKQLIGHEAGKAAAGRAIVCTRNVEVEVPRRFHNPDL